jgi:tryptophan synthase beta chain
LSTGGGVESIPHRYGPYGGQYVPETLMPALAELEQAWVQARADTGFNAELEGLLRDFVGRPSPLYLARRLSEAAGRELWLKREDLNHTGSHKINNAIGQALLAKRMGKPRIIAETGAGQHGVATATACALLDLECVIYMGTEDMRRQKPNVERMGLLGATVEPVEAGTRTLKEACSAAIRDWVTNVATTHYILGTAAGPAPYPALVRDLQRVIGDEARAQILEREGRLPQRVIACVGGGSNAIGIFTPFMADEVELVGVEAAGEGIDTGRHGAPLTVGERPGILHGAYSAVMQDADGQILEAHSISAGLDYPGVGPEHAWLRDTGRARYEAVTDADALAALQRLARLEGIIPALESSHAIAWAMRNGGSANDLDLVCLSGRGDKDLAEVIRRIDDERGVGEAADDAEDASVPGGPAAA